MCEDLRLVLRPIGTIPSPYRSTGEVRERMQSGEDVSEKEVYPDLERGQVRVGWLEDRPGKGRG